MKALCSIHLSIAELERHFVVFRAFGWTDVLRYLLKRAETDANGVFAGTGHRLVETLTVL